MAITDPIIEYEKALALVFDAQAITRKGLRANPDKQGERKLNKRLAMLGVEEADLVAMIDALEESPLEDLPMPDKALVKKIALLTGKVEKSAGQIITVKGALNVTGDILDLAIKLTGD